MNRLPRLLFLFIVVTAMVAGAPAEGKQRSFDVDYRLGFEPAAKRAVVTMTVRDGDGRASRFDFDMPADRYTAIEGDGAIERTGERLVWIPPEAGGELRWHYAIDKRRRQGGHDARITDDWTIVRGDDLFPSARVRMTPNTDSDTRLFVDLPEGWSNVDTPWKRSRDEKSFVVVNADSRFDRPTGWIIAGDVGSRREQYDDVEVSVAAPKGDSMPRQQILAMVGWTLPEMTSIFGKLPSKLLIVGAGDEMWRGGLSGPRSLYMHSARPLISENGTSTLLHELTHVITRISGEAGHKYISEGIAEYYSIELLHRTGGTTDARYQRTRDMLERWGKDVKSLVAPRAHGPITARAVLLFMALDKEIREATDDEKSFDDVTRLLMAKRRVDTDDLVAATTQVLGRPSTTLATPLLP
jgi:hypothetical protein